MTKNQSVAEPVSDYDHVTAYPYFEDVNEGVLRQLPPLGAGVPAARVLDLGCGYGALGESIRARGYEVWGVETNTAALAKAKRRLDHAFAGDIIDVEALHDVLGENTFDYLVLSDVLEHLPDPSTTLRSYHQFLSRGGKVIVSLPNVANWQTRLGLLFGRFDYTDFGVLDRTHLHFFTAKSARQLVEDSGFSVTQTDFTPLIVRALAPKAKQLLSRRNKENDDPTRVIIDSSSYAWYLKAIYPLEYLVCKVAPGLFAFRIILVASDSSR